MKRYVITCLVFLLAITALSYTASGQKKSPSLNHIAFHVMDLKKSTAFYRDIIGIDTMPEPFHDGRHTWFTIGEHSQLHLIAGATKITEHEKDTHLCFTVQSIDEVIARLEKSNINYTNWAGTGKTPTIRVDGVKQIYLQDPDGYWLEINTDKY